MPRPTFARHVAPLALFLAASCGSNSDTPVVTPPPTAVTPPGAPTNPGAAGDVLLDSDGTLTADGRAMWTVPVRADERVRVTITSTTFDPILVVQPPGAGRLSNDDFNGDRARSELDLRIATAGDMKIEVAAWGAAGPGSYHVHAERVTTPAAVAVAPGPAGTHHTRWALPGMRGYIAGAVPAAGTAPAAAAVRLGDRLEGSLSTGDATLPSGEFADHFALTVTEPGHFAIQMESRSLDSFLLVTGPNGERFENDDSGGSLDSLVEIDATAAGEWSIIATTYRPGMTGSYELKVLSARDVVAALPLPVPGTPPGTAPPAGTERVERGALATGDTQLSSGEWYDTYEMSWPVGTVVHLEARSRAFDTYLILRTPSGRQTDNDDQVPGNLNAALDFVVSEAGAHRVLVTSYAPGMSGDYELAVRGGGTGAATGPAPGTPPPSTPPPAAGPPVAGLRTERGELAAGDRTLSSGEFMDAFPMTFTPGSPISIRVESTEFDTYLILRSPSGRQQDNDDIRPGILNSGIDIPSAEAGEYSVTVTSYRPGETGHYTLTAGAGAGGAPPSVATPGAPGTPTPGAPAGPIPTGGSRVWTVSVGISDYPGSANDLPECANDAVKIAEALRNQGLTATDREFLLTDANATRANIRSALTRVAAGIQPGDVFVFFYSGHGGQTRAARADDPNELDGLDEYMVAYDGNIMDDELGTLLTAIHARSTLVALDSCFSGGFAKDVVNRPDVVGMFSSEEDVTSGVAPEFRAGGYLSHFLRMGIGGDGDSDPRDRALTVGELSHYVWRQYAEHAVDLRMGEGYQHLVVDRGSVHNDTVLWNVGR